MASFEVYSSWAEKSTGQTPVPFLFESYGNGRINDKICRFVFAESDGNVGKVLI